MRMTLRATALAVATCVALPLAAACANAGDPLMLQQTELPEEAGRVQLLLDRERVVMAELRKQAKPPYLVQITLEGQPPIVVSVRCLELGDARQVMDALRPRGVANLDVSGRCRF